MEVKYYWSNGWRLGIIKTNRKWAHIVSAESLPIRIKRVRVNKLATREVTSTKNVTVKKLAAQLKRKGRTYGINKSAQKLLVSA